MILGAALQSSLACTAGTTLAASSAAPLSFFTYNTHLFGRLGRIGDCETGLVFHDEYRAEKIAAGLRRVQPDVVGLTEVWDGQIGEAIESELSDIYPYRLSSPAAQGIQDIIDSLNERWPRGARLLFDNVEGLVSFFSKSHYQVDNDSLLQGGLKTYIKEDWMMWALKYFLRLPDVWGAGLLLLSKYPLSQEEFVLYPARADLERFVGKGVLSAVVTPPNTRPVTTLLTHLQEGESVHAMRAREKQILQMRELIDRSPHPVVAMGDFNIRAETIFPNDQTWTRQQEYLWMASVLGLIDAYRAVYPRAPVAPGYTYDHNNPFASKLGVGEAPEQGEHRIDFIFASRELAAQSSRVSREEFQDEREGYDLSDHFPVEASLQPAA